MASSSVNPLLSSQTSSQQQTVLHPLVLLTISDYITRHTLREQQGPIVGAVLGQQNGREITMEHAIECQTKQDPNTEGGYLLEWEQFLKRLDQMKTVHKDRQLDLVGWYTLLPRTGPTPVVVPIHEQILVGYNESAVLLGFHPSEVADHSPGSKLPLTIYESNYEVDDPRGEQDGDDKKMEDGDTVLKLKFRELPYTVETSEAEMISMDFVASGGGNATAVDANARKPSVAAAEPDAKGKKRAVATEGAQKKPAKEGKEKEKEADTDLPLVALSREEEEMISALTAKANAIKMLHARIQLLRTYLERLPPSYQSTDGQSSEAAPADASHTTPSHTILRSILALVNRLELLVPSDTEAFGNEILLQENNVNLVSLLNDIMQSIGDARDVGKKFGVVETAKLHNRRLPGQDFVASPSTSFSLPTSGDLMG